MMGTWLHILFFFLFFLSLAVASKFFKDVNFWSLTGCISKGPFEVIVEGALKGMIVPPWETPVVGFCLAFGTILPPFFKGKALTLLPASAFVLLGLFVDCEACSSTFLPSFELFVASILCFLFAWLEFYSKSV